MRHILQKFTSVLSLGILLTAGNFSTLQAQTQY